MDPLTVPLALGCVMIFSHVDRGLTELYGDADDGAYYQAVTLQNAHGRHRVLEPARPGQGFSPAASLRAGRSPDGLFASYIVAEQAAGHNVQDVRFVSASSCGPVRFVRVRDGFDAAGAYQGWLKGSPHTVRVWRDGQAFEPGLPIDEARRANPAIKE